MLCLLIARLSPAQQNHHSPCIKEIEHIAYTDSTGILFPAIRSCCCEQDYFSISLVGARINTKPFARRRSILRRRARVDLLVLTRVSTPAGNIERITYLDAFALLENAEPFKTRDDTIYEMRLPDFTLAGPMPALPGEYAVELTFFALTPQAKEKIIIPPSAHTLQVGGEDMSMWIGHWYRHGLLQGTTLRYAVDWTVFPESEERLDAAGALRIGYVALLDDCTKLRSDIVLVDDAGSLRDELDCPLETDYVALRISREVGVSISSLEEVQEKLTLLNQQQMTGKPTRNTLNETFRIIAQVPYITEYDKYLYKLDLFAQFGNPADLPELEMTPVSPCEVVPPTMSKKEELIFLSARQLLIRMGAIPPGGKLGSESWQEVVRALDDANLWPLAKRFSNCSPRQLKAFLLGILGPEPAATRL